MTIDDASLAAFRFQGFCIDTIYPLLNERGSFGSDSSRAFASGELREAVAMAALGVACHCYPRELFSGMLNLVKDELDGTHEKIRLAERFPEGWPPPPVNGLPNSDEALAWSQVEMYSKTIDVMPEVLDDYASLMRQVRRDDYYRKFNAQLLFAQDEIWQEDVRTFQFAVIPLITSTVDEPESIWLPEGLDSFYDLAEDLGVNVAKDASGRFAGFDIAHVQSLDWSTAASNIAGHSLLPLTAWRFGGLTYAERVGQRVGHLQSLISEIVMMVESRSWGGQIVINPPFDR